jgi:hypothetical protein
MRLLVIAAVVFAATLQPANACRDPKWNTRTLLTSLPPDYDRPSRPRLRSLPSTSLRIILRRNGLPKRPSGS